MLSKIQEFWENQIEPQLPPNLVATARLRGVGFLQIPMLFFVRPTVVECNDERVVVKIPLGRRSKNHLGSMYFGAIAVGADTAVGLLAVRWMQKKKTKRVVLVFKDFHVDFLKRAEGDVHFVCEEGLRIRDQMEKVLANGERVTQAIHGYAIVPSVSTTEPVAKFSLGLSLKRK